MVTGISSGFLAAVAPTTANELQVPLSDPKSPTPTFLPRLAGKTDVIPNRKNSMRIDLHVAVGFVAAFLIVGPPPEDIAASLCQPAARLCSRFCSSPGLLLMRALLFLLRL